MQFIPGTWRIYGEGDIRDPHDAIRAAARLLRDRGAPGNYARALYAYNNSKLYVQAVSIYAKLIARDPDAMAILYCWGPWRIASATTSASRIARDVVDAQDVGALGRGEDVGGDRPSQPLVGLRARQLSDEALAELP